MYLRVWSVLLIFFIYSCASPTPFDSLLTGEEKLTEKHLGRLGTGTPDFSPFKVGLIADPQVYPGYLNQVIAELDKKEDLDFYMILGDLTDRSLKYEFEMVAHAIKKAKRPVLTVVGNHDGISNGEKIYKKMFGALNYSFVYNGVTFIMWNNNPYEWGMPDFDWLNKTVEGSKQSVVVSHQPPGSLERYANANDLFYQSLADPKVVGSFHGHMHKFDLREFKGKPIYTVARVFDISYGIASFTASGVSIEKCVGATCKTF